MGWASRGDYLVACPLLSVRDSNAQFGREVERQTSNLLAKIDLLGASRDARCRWPQLTQSYAGRVA